MNNSVGDPTFQCGNADNGIGKVQAPAYFGERGDAYVLICEYAIN
jgi:hypothetical protein